jgi:murein DD-endopeptidase MepM/ murein hydrolase activator NlpD
VAEGEVVTVIDGVPDNRPLTFNLMTYVGNLVILKHKNNEYSRYGHLKINSISVKVGQRVVSGQVIGLCGNSGYSSSSHLHFDLTNTDVVYDATGFAPYFQNVVLRKNDIKSITEDYTPIKYDKVQNK